MAVKYTNNAATLITGTVSTSATSIPITSNTGFPTLGAGDYTYLTLVSGPTLEVIKVTAIASTSLTCVRAQDNTTASAFSSGDRCELRLTSAMLTDALLENVSATATSATNAAASQVLAAEYAVKAEDSTITGTSAYSALHHAAKATVSAASAATAKTAAETAETNAETAETNAETAETAAEAAQTASVNAKTSAETARDAALAAQAAAEVSAGAISWKAPVLAATTANLATTYSNGSSGVGATLTATSNGAIALDGISPVVNDRVLVKDQTAAAQNGTYIVTTKGTGSAAFVLTRASAMNTYAEFISAIVPVSQGTASADKSYICTSDAGGTIGTTAITFTAFGAAPAAVNVTVDNYAAGSGFTAGSTTSLAITVAAATENDILVLFDGIYQHHDTFSVSGTTVTFSSAIPTGTLDVEIRGTSALGVGVPAAGSVTNTELAAGPAKDLNGLAVTNNLMYVGNGSNIVGESGATLRTTIGVGTGDSPQVTGINLGHATDTTLTRVSAGVIAVEGSTVVTGVSPQLTSVELGHATDTTLTRVSAGVLAVEGNNVVTGAGAGLSKSGVSLAVDLTADQSWTGSQRSTPVANTSGSFDMATGNNFNYTPSGNQALTFTNITAGQGGILYVVNSGHTITKHASVKVDANLLATVTAAGTYMLGYYAPTAAIIVVTNSLAVT